MEQVSAKDPYSPIWWNVAFMPRDTVHWWDVITVKWARHVLCWGYVVQTRSWLVVNPAIDKTIVCSIPDDEFDEYLSVILEADATILQIKAGHTKVLSQRILQNCSTVVARVIGINGPALTPKMLYKRLRANNATVKVDPFNVCKSPSP